MSWPVRVVRTAACGAIDVTKSGEILDRPDKWRFDENMRSLRTFLVLLLIVPFPGRAAERELMPTFAACAGRFSAELEHAWLMTTGATTQIENRRDQFIDLIKAVVPEDQQRHALNLRIEAKAAHAHLLTQAVFSDDPARSRWASRRAQSQIALCTGFLLES